jgi:hypothetical protein
MEYEILEKRRGQVRWAILIISCDNQPHSVPGNQNTEEKKITARSDHATPSTNEKKFRW